MNVTKVNATLSKGIAALALAENDALVEMYTGSGGSFGTPDVSPSGDPLRGGDGGVDNLASDAEAFDSYIEQTAMTVAARCSISIDAALDAIVAVADEMAEAGKIPAMPDPESGSSEELSAWAGAAKTSQLGGEVITYCMSRSGDITQGTGGGAA